MTGAFETLQSACPTLSVGVITADLLRLGEGVALLEDAGCQVLHFDVMDGVFCPALTVGPPFVKAVRTKMLKDAHLMIVEPLEKLGDYVKAGADIITVQVESCRHVHRALRVLGAMENANDAARGIVRGIALNPGTPVEALEPLLDEVEMVLLLAVDPGWGGQKLIESTRRRIERTKELISASGRDILICVDGGITRDNVVEVAHMGADLIVTGSAVFDGKAAAENARLMLRAAAGSGQ